MAVSGNLIFNGDLIMTGLGWGQGPIAGGTTPGLEAVVAALVPQVRRAGAWLLVANRPTAGGVARVGGLAAA